MDMKKLPALALFIGLALIGGCAMNYTAADFDRLGKDMMKASFQTRGQAHIDRINQDEVNAACSAADLSGKPIDAALQRRLEAAELAKVVYPADGKFLGDWRKGEVEAQSGRGATWSDKAGEPNGGNCYNCHQISKAEISYGTLGPSLYQYGKLRGDSEAVVKYTWAKIFNAKAFNLCTNMPRFGHEKMLTEAQMKDLMALLLDPESPVNKN